MQAARARSTLNWAHAVPLGGLPAAITSPYCPLLASKLPLGYASRHALVFAA